MKRARVLVLCIALAAAIGAAVLVKGFVPEPKKVVAVKKDLNTVQVLVAANSIKLGDALKASDLRWQSWPKNAALQGYVTKEKNPKALSNYSGAIARAPFLSGEPIKALKLIKASDGGVMAAILPTGMRAISTPIREETAAGGFILPNDRVDVIVSRKFRTARREEHISETVLTNIRVLAIGQTIEQKKGNKVANGKTATLELTPRQAELLSLAQSMGDISLSLRSLADANRAGPNGPNGNNFSFGKRESGTVKMLKYGISSRAFGVN